MEVWGLAAVSLGGVWVISCFMGRGVLASASCGGVGVSSCFMGVLSGVYEVAEVACRLI